MTELSKVQQEAAKHFTGPALTLAGPGSGKTRVMTERTLFLAEKTAAPERILSVTFTNAAADEMRDRFRIMSRENARNILGDEPVFKTVHSYCNLLIRKYEKLSSVRYERIESVSGRKVKLLGKIYKEINGEEADPYILGQMNNGFSGRADPEIKNYKKIIKRYEAYKKEKRLIDFDDMILLALDILNSDNAQEKHIRECEQEHFKFIQVDEAQDLTKEQFEILQIIAASGNIFVVADDDQSIYGFRGAAPSCLTEFAESNPDCKVYKLSRNYRSVRSIVKISESFIAKNSGRFDKDLYSENEQGVMPRIKACADSAAQMEFVYKEINKLRRRNNELTVGILYRNNISGHIARAYLSRMREEYSVDASFERSGSIVFLDKILNEIRNAERRSIFIPTPLKTFMHMLENGFEKDFEEYCRKTRQHMRYKDAVISFAYYICGVCDSWKEIIRLIETMDTRSDRPIGGGIRLSTVHSSKGLEYDAVFIIDALMGEFPGSGATEGLSLEEERRLFYVAMTRAKKYLYVTYPAKRGNPFSKKENERESVFVSELRENIRKFDI